MLRPALGCEGSAFEKMDGCRGCFESGELRDNTTGYVGLKSFRV